MGLTINEELTQEATRLKAEIAQLKTASTQTEDGGVINGIPAGMVPTSDALAW